MNRILFVNHRTKECGVNQLGKRYFDAFKHSQKFECHYIDVDAQFEYEYWVNELQPSAVVFNFYSGATMPWLSRGLIDSKRSQFKQLGIYHELPLDDKNFDLILHQDPTSEDTFPHWKLPRPIPEYSGEWDGENPLNHQIPVFSSFGFGLGGKGFGTMIDRIQEEYDQAIIRLNIAFAKFGDADGSGAKSWAVYTRSRLYKPDIQLAIAHNFMEENHVLDFLSYSTCNCFFYDENYGRGIASVTDYALAVNRPIAITRSHQFKHLWGIDDSFTIEKHSLREIVKMGTDHLDKFHQVWNRENLISSFEQALESIGV